MQGAARRAPAEAPPPPPAAQPSAEQPRPYQAEIITCALQHNVLVSLGTGTGKTLIAAEVLRARSSALRAAGKVGTGRPHKSNRPPPLPPDTR
jgi:hypothetical protein